MSWKKILYIGIPAILTQILFPISNVILTRIAANLGEPTVAAFGVGSRIESIAMIGSMALSSVIIPFIGQNFGAQNYKRIKSANNFTIKFALIWGALTWLFLALISEAIAWTFSDDIEIRILIRTYFWIVPFGFAFHSISQLTSASCNALNKPFHSTAINIIRLIIFIIPMVYIGSQLFGTSGFFTSITAANFITGIMSWYWFQKFILPKALNK